MSVFQRVVTVSFHVIEPFGPENRWTGEYPAAEVLSHIETLDLASGDYHLKRRLFGTEVFCAVHDDGPQPILASYTKDVWWAVMTERKGEISSIDMRDGEGPIDGAFAAFFEPSVVGIIRSSLKSPGPASTADWLSQFTPYSCVFNRLPAPASALLAGPADRFLSATFIAKKRQMARIREARPDLAGALDAAAGVGRSSKPGVVLATEHRDERSEWWTTIRAIIDDLDDAELLEDFAKASVRVSKVGDVNLKKTFLTFRQPVAIQGNRRLAVASAAEALLRAYEQNQGEIREAVAAWRTEREQKARQSPRRGRQPDS